MAIYSILNAMGTVGGGMKISVVLPVYNVEDYVVEAVRSVLGQKLETELIIVNDGSTDDSFNRVKQFAKFSNVKLITTVNGGLSSARNVGIKHATGDLIYFMDSDDVLRPNFFENVTLVMEKYDLDMVNFDYEEYSDKNIVISKSVGVGTLVNIEFYKTTEDILHALMKGELHQMAWSYIIKRNIFEKKSNRFSEGRLFEDNNSAVRFFGSAQKAGKLMFENSPYLLRKRSGSITAQAYKNKSINELDDELFVFEDAYFQYVNCEIAGASRWLLSKKIHLRIKYGNSNEVQLYASEKLKELTENIIQTPLKIKLCLSVRDKWRYLRIRSRIIDKTVRMLSGEL